MWKYFPLFAKLLKKCCTFLYILCASKKGWLLSKTNYKILEALGHRVILIEKRQENFKETVCLAQLSQTKTKQKHLNCQTAAIFLFCQIETFFLNPILGSSFGVQKVSGKKLFSLGNHKINGFDSAWNRVKSKGWYEWIKGKFKRWYLLAYFRDYISTNI